MDRRIQKHPILGESGIQKEVRISVDGRELVGIEGESIAATLYAAGIRTNRYTLKQNEARGVFCGIGQCTDCIMVVNGIPNVRTCITLVEDGMAVETQRGLTAGGKKSD